jgi:hypothetical protein
MLVPLSPRVGGEVEVQLAPEVRHVDKNAARRLLEVERSHLLDWMESVAKATGQKIAQTTVCNG